MVLKRTFSGILSYIKRSDIILWLLIGAISGYSLLLLNSVSNATGEGYDRTQLMAITIGVIGAIFISLIDYQSIANFWYLIAGFSVFIMIYTLIFGDTVIGNNGVNATAWILIGGRSFQPSELVKIMFMITYAKHLDSLKRRELLDAPLHVIFLFFHAIVPVLLCYYQGDDGAGMVFLAMFLAMSFSAGIKARYFIILFAGILAMIPILWQFVLKDYQKNRFTAVYNLDTDPNVRMEGGYQQWHGRISIGSGGLSGSGLGNGSRVAAKSVALQQSDFIFSVAGEELGFIGCSAIILLLLLLMIKVLHVASTSRDGLGKYMCFGFFGLIAFQSVVNIGMCLTLLPVTGVTLPFFSSGGSSAMCLYFGVGLIQGVYMRRQETDGSHLNRTETMRFSYRQMKSLKRS